MNKFNLKTQSCVSCHSLACSIFSDAPDQELKQLDELKTCNQYRRKQTIFYEGNPLLGLYFVRSGRVKLYKSSPDGKQQILRIAASGDILGHVSLFSSEPHNVTAEAIEDSEICFLDKNAFLSFLRQDASVAFKLFSRLSRELIEAEEKVLDLAYKSARVRFAEFLLMLKESFGVSDKGAHRLDISLSREELAQAVGMTLETAVRLLSEFREEGYIEVKKRAITIREPEKLIKLTESGF